MSAGRELRAVIDRAGERPEQRLRAIAALREELDRAELEEVRTALSEGAPWSRIGDALGVSRQAAHQKHSATAYEIDRRVAVTPSARRAVRLARDEAVSRGADEVAVAHLLIGLLQVDAAAARKLAVRGLTPETVRARLEPANGNRPSPDDETHLSEQTQSVLSAAMRDAVDRGHEELLPEHLLAAVLRIL